MKFFVGVEGVSLRQSVAVACDEAANVLSAVRWVGAPLSFHTVHRDTFRTRLVSLLHELCQKAGVSLDDLKYATLCIGLNGVSFPYEQHVELPQEIGAAEIEPGALICTGDAEIIFASHVQSLCGSALISHISSVAFVAAHDKRVKLGGWGPALADDGSGYWIGRRAIRAVGAEYENRERPSVLWACINEWLLKPQDGDLVPDWTAASFLWRKCTAAYSAKEADPRTALLSFARSLYLQQEWQWRAIASSLVIPVMKAWDAGDPAAKDILTSAALALVKLYKRALHQMEVSRDEGPLVLSGGVLTHNERFRELLASRLKSEGLMPGRIVTATTKGTMRPACGALLFALGGSTTGDLRLPAEHLISHLVESQSHLHDRGDLRND